MNVNIPKRRFKGFSEDWKQCKLGELGKDYSGLTGKTKKDFGHGESLYVPYKNIFNNHIVDVDNLEKVNVSSKQNKVKYGDIFFTISSEVPEEVGMSSVMRKDINNLYLNSFSFGLRPYENSELDMIFSSYLFRTLTFRKKMYILAQGISRYNISKANVMKLEIALPSVNEQKKIGRLLYKLDSMITLHKRKFEKLKQLQKSYLNESIFSEPKCVPKRRFKGFVEPWEQRELGEIANIIPGGTPKTTVKDYWWPKEIPWMSSGEINKRIVEKTDDMISKNGFENSSAKLIKEKSVLIALAGQGKTRGLVAVNEVPLTTNQSIAAFELEANITNYKFLFYTLDRQYMRLRHISSGDGTRGGLNKNLLESYKSHFPVLEEQNHISEFISKIENLITLHKHKHNAIKILQKIYLQNNLKDETYA